MDKNNALKQRYSDSFFARPSLRTLTINGEHEPSFVRSSYHTSHRRNPIVLAFDVSSLLARGKQRKHIDNTCDAKFACGTMLSYIRSNNADGYPTRVTGRRDTIDVSRQLGHPITWYLSSLIHANWP